MYIEHEIPLSLQIIEIKQKTERVISLAKKTDAQKHPKLSYINLHIFIYLQSPK